MRWWPRPSRSVLTALALIFAAPLLAYSGLWLVLTKPEPVPSVQLGFDDAYLPSEHAQLIQAVYKDSPAAKAGLLPGDRIVAIDGQPVTGASFRQRVWMLHSPGDQIRLTIARPGAKSLVFLIGTFPQNPVASLSALLGRQLSNWFPVPFILVGLVVLFLRLEDPNAWLLVLVFGGLVVSRGFPPPDTPPAWWPLVMAYQALLFGMFGPLFYWFFAVFPARPPIDRRLPWLRWGSPVIGCALVWGGIRSGGVRLPLPLHRLVGENAPLESPF